jgi:sugar diacid utilization regulator
MAHDPDHDPEHLPDRDTVDVAALLAEPLLRNTLVAGVAGVHRPVQWCLPLAEVDADPGSGNGAHPQSGVAVHAPAARLRGPAGADVVRSLAGRGAVAVLVRTEPADVAAPGELHAAFPEARGAADDAGLPLALLPPTADYRAVSQLVATKVLAQATHVLQYSDRVHRSLGEILARGAGIPPLAYGMARMSGAPVMVTDLDGTVLAFEATSSTPKPAPAPVAAALCRHLEQVVELTAKAARPGVSVLDAVGDGSAFMPIVAPVMYGGELNGLVAVLEPAGGDPHDRAQRRIVAEEGAVLIGSEMLRIRSMTEAEERIRGDFVVGLVHGRFQDGQQLLARARYHGFNPDGRYAVHVAAVDPALPDDQRAVRRVQSVIRAVEKLDSRRRTLATQVGGHLVVVRQVGRGEGPPPDALAEQQLVRDFAGKLRRLVRERLDGEVRVSFGRVGTGAGGVATSYRQARTALALGLRVDVPPVSGYDELRVFVALREIADSETGRSFADEVLGPLRKADGHARNLETVVLAYIAESGNLNAAARRLGLHRNTALYKLDRVSRALGMDIRSADTQFMVWLAHHIDTLVQVGDGLDAELAPPP